MKNNVKISASLMCANPLDMIKDIEELVNSGIDILHVDILDGHFAENIALNIEHVAAIKRNFGLPVEVHLMVKNPSSYIKRLAEAKADIVFAHIEHEEDMKSLLKRIKESGMKAGIGVKAETPIEDVIPYLKDVDAILFMCTKTGFKGNPFVPEVLKKISTIREKIQKNNLKVELFADGAINPNTIPGLYKAGIRTFVGGTSGLFKDGGFKKNIESLRNSANV